MSNKVKDSVYIASSWKNQHAVEMLTELLRKNNFTVHSFVENEHGEQCGYEAQRDGKPLPFDEWIYSVRGKKSFDFDTQSAARCEYVIYVGPSGCDAWAEIGIAYASGAKLFGLQAKGEQVGLMRRLIDFWYTNFNELLVALDCMRSQEFIKPEN